MLHVEIRMLSTIKDDRGWFAEILKNDSPDHIGQIHFSVSKEGVTRGNHYHKNRIEWLLVTNGIGTIYLKDNFTGRRKELTLSEKEPVLVKIYPNVTHAIVNSGQKPMHLIVIANLPHSSENPDTYTQPIFP